MGMEFNDSREMTVEEIKDYIRRVACAYAYAGCVSYAEFDRSQTPPKCSTRPAQTVASFTPLTAVRSSFILFFPLLTVLTTSHRLALPIPLTHHKPSYGRLRRLF